MKFTMTHESITIVTDDGPVTVRKGHPNYVLLRQALADEDEDRALSLLTVEAAVREWSSGQFIMQDEAILFENDTLPPELNKRILAMVTGGDDPSHLLRFWERLADNPSWRSTQQLFRFLDHEGIPIQPDGTILVYKSVRSNLTDHHTGTVKNAVGSVHEMPRNKISDDPNTACHYGFHVGALEYARDFGSSGSRIVICEVDPAHVVCVPYDASSQKVRVCSYKVIGFHSGTKLPSTTIKKEKAPPKPKSKPKGKGTKGQGGDWGPLSPDDIVKLDKMDLLALTKLHIVTLRRYASHLKVVGAYKLPGGKATLLAAIGQARD